MKQRLKEMTLRTEKQNQEVYDIFLNSLNTGINGQCPILGILWNLSKRLHNLVGHIITYEGCEFYSLLSSLNFATLVSSFRKK